MHGPCDWYWLVGECRNFSEKAECVVDRFDAYSLQLRACLVIQQRGLKKFIG